MALTTGRLVQMRLHKLLLQQDSQARTAANVVSRLGAVQAQDYMMAQWAVGLRLPPGTQQQEVEAALQSGTIIRTHILRPTWHLVAAEDLRWMLQLTAPPILRLIVSLFNKDGISPSSIHHSLDVIGHALEGGRHLLRQQLHEALQQAGIVYQPGQMSLLMMYAELNALVCSGVYKGRMPTYALTDERIGPAAANTFSRTEALGTLALRYFRGHGPATMTDLCWWSSLSKTDARLGLNQVQDQLKSATVDGQQYWFQDDMEPALEYGTLLLPAFDEFLVGYKDRSATLAPAYNAQVITKNGIFKPVILDHGRVAGIWSSTPVKNGLRIQARLFDAGPAPEPPALQQATDHYSRFKGLTASLKVEGF
jgi:hypothetical protein